MSDTIGSDSSVGSDRTAARTANAAHTANAAEAYAFACLNCGYGWEQAYEIEHHVDAQGSPFVTYLADGVKVPSPLTRPSCRNCGGHHVRIMRSGQVSDVASLWAAGRGQRGVRRTRHWSLLHFLHRRQGETDTA